MMRHNRFVAWSCFLVAWVTVVFGLQQLAALQSATPHPIRQPDTNLLLNPDFEGPYSSYIYPDPGHPDCGGTVCERAQMPDGWHPRWRDTPRPEPWINIMPEYTQSTPDQVNPDRVRSGQKSLHYFSFWSTHETAVYQQLPVTTGRVYLFSAWGHAWSDRISEDFYSATPDRPADDGQLYQRVGIDPTGGTDWQANTVLWSEARKQYDYFGQFVVTATAQANLITVFLWSQAEVPVKHNDVYWDDAQLREEASLTVWPPRISAMTTPTEPLTVTTAVQILLSPTFTWTAAFSPTGNLTASLNTTMGQPGDPLTVTFSTVGLTLGTYTTTLTITASDPLPGSPAQLPITLYIVPRRESTFLPLISQP